MKTSLSHLLLWLSLGAWLAPVQAIEPPAASQDDAPLKIIEKYNPAFPPRLLQEGIVRGEAQIIFLVDSTGKLGDYLVTAYTHKDFADVALAAIKTWKFAPSQIKGKPIGTVVDMRFIFEMNGVVTIDRKPGVILASEQWETEGRFAFQPCPAKQLDRPLQMVHVVKPVYPKELGDQGVVGKVLVEFYIDETGKTRMPTASRTSNETLAMIAIAAVDQWQFEPPTRQGKPVIVCANQEFSFVPDK
jgi:TonB family protein